MTKQTQILDYQQLQQQKQDLVHCNNSFGMLLSSVESFFIKSGYNIRVLFGYYNHFNDISWKTKDEIKSQLYLDLMLYKSQKKAFFTKYNEVYFPDSPPINEIIQVIEQWKKIAKNKEEKKICDEILDLINDKNAKPMSYYYKQIEGIESSFKADPTKSFQFSNKIHNIMDKRNEWINDELRRNPNAHFGLEIGKQPGTSEFSPLGNNINMSYSNSTEQLNLEHDITNKMNDLICIIKNYKSNSKLNLKLLYENCMYITIKIDENRDLRFLFKNFNIDNQLKNVKILIENENKQNNIDALNTFKDLLDKLINHFRYQ